MRIQAANTFYTGTYSVLNTKSSFPYAVKVEGYLFLSWRKHNGL